VEFGSGDINVVLICNCFSQYYILQPSLLSALANLRSKIGRWLICNKSVTSATSGITDEEIHGAAEKYIVEGSSALLRAAKYFYEFMGKLEVVRVEEIKVDEAKSMLENALNELKTTVEKYNEMIEFIKTAGFIPNEIKDYLRKEVDLKRMYDLAAKYTLLSQDDVDRIVKAFREGDPLAAVTMFVDSVNELITDIAKIKERLDQIKESYLNEGTVIELASLTWVANKKLMYSISLGSLIAAVNIVSRPEVERIRKGAVTRY